jgi:Xaa-Pro dipeptidase
MNEERLEQTRAAMADQRLDALVSRLPENLVMLSGHWPLCGDAFLVFPREGQATCIVPDTQEEEAGSELWSARILVYGHGRVDSDDQSASIRKLLRSLGQTQGWKRIGVEASPESVALPGNTAEPRTQGEASRAMIADSFPGAEIVDAAPMLDALRETKTGFEAGKTTIACEIANIGISAFFEEVDVGKSAVELAAAVESAIMLRGTGYRGARRVRGFAQVAVGDAETSRGWRPFELTTTRKLESGEIALLELAVVADGYWSDRTRARVAGKARPEQLAAHAAIQAAQDAALASIRAGADAKTVDAAARSSLAASGLDSQFLHITGHGVGFRYHEPYPMLTPSSADVLRSGAIVTVEPGVYSPSFGGIRIEDDVLVTEQGYEILAPFPREFV